MIFLRGGGGCGLRGFGLLGRVWSGRNVSCDGFVSGFRGFGGLVWVGYDGVTYHAADGGPRT